MDIALVAVFGTLAGALVTGLQQHLTVVHTQHTAHTAAQRQALTDAVPVLLKAIVEFREVQFLKIRAKREGRADAQEAVERRYAARSRMTTAHDALYLVTGDEELLAVAQEAVTAAIALGDVTTYQDEVAAARDRARRAHTALRIAGARAVQAFN
ncbi:hypothetical protein [Streptomyces sasae]|uniref:hypothetical protein n=1 Tax=Streptomyces sasae TaxID=1266772 RepID=UPI00292F88D6|nr:hypothetical protein [Streptomyces sasae]